jgi:hypothetical protein
MGINSTEVAYNFGQLGSGHLQAGSTALTPPTGKVIVAITFLDNIELSALVPEQVYGADTYIGTGSKANTANNSVVIDTDVTFPKGVTIYGRFTSVTMNTANANGIICYFGQ